MQAPERMVRCAQRERRVRIGSMISRDAAWLATEALGGLALHDSRQTQAAYADAVQLTDAAPVDKRFDRRQPTVDRRVSPLSANRSLQKLGGRRAWMIPARPRSRVQRSRGREIFLSRTRRSRIGGEPRPTAAESKGRFLPCVLWT